MRINRQRVSERCEKRIAFAAAKLRISSTAGALRCHLQK